MKAGCNNSVRIYAIKGFHSLSIRVPLASDEIWTYVHEYRSFFRYDVVFARGFPQWNIANLQGFAMPPKAKSFGRTLCPSGHEASRKFHSFRVDPENIYQFRWVDIPQ